MQIKTAKWFKLTHWNFGTCTGWWGVDGISSRNSELPCRWQTDGSRSWACCEPETPECRPCVLLNVRTDRGAAKALNGARVGHRAFSVLGTPPALQSQPCFPRRGGRGEVQRAKHTGCMTLHLDELDADRLRAVPEPASPHKPPFSPPSTSQLCWRGSFYSAVFYSMYQKPDSTENLNVSF